MLLVKVLRSLGTTVVGGLLVGVVLKGCSSRDLQSAGRCLDSTPVQTGTRKNAIFGNAPRGVETHPQDSDDFLVTSAGCQERSKGGQEWWKK